MVEVTPGPARVTWIPFETLAMGLGGNGVGHRGFPPVGTAAANAAVRTGNASFFLCYRLGSGGRARLVTPASPEAEGTTATGGGGGRGRRSASVLRDRSDFFRGVGEEA